MSMDLRPVGEELVQFLWHFEQTCAIVLREPKYLTL